MKIATLLGKRGSLRDSRPPLGQDLTSYQFLILNLSTTLNMVTQPDFAFKT